MDIIVEKQYSPRLLLVLTLLVGLNILDSIFTMMILDLGGEEANPILRSVIQVYGDYFWIWKFALVSAGVFLLCLGSRVKYIKGVIVVLTCLYFVVVGYEIVLLSLR